MSKIGNKVINYNIYSKINQQSVYLGDTLNVQLPSVEMLTDTIKGAGIMGEIDLPTLTQTGSMSCTISFRNATLSQMALFAPKLQDFEIRYVVDKYDSATGQTSVQQHKVYLKGYPKKFDPGKVEANASQEGTDEFEIVYMNHILDGVSVIEIDKLNNIFKINGVDYAKEIREAL